MFFHDPSEEWEGAPAGEPLGVTKHTTPYPSLWDRAGPWNCTFIWQLIEDSEGIFLRLSPNQNSQTCVPLWFPLYSYCFPHLSVHAEASFNYEGKRYWILRPDTGSKSNPPIHSQCVALDGVLSLAEPVTSLLKWEKCITGWLWKSNEKNVEEGIAI